jgi:pentose-5-phosphate-3-epimerase
LREIWPNGNIEVDGGVNEENIGKAVEAGANLICVGTFIFQNKNIKDAIENLRQKL